MKYKIQYSFKEAQIRVNNYIFSSYLSYSKYQTITFEVEFIQLLRNERKCLLYTLPHNDWAPFK